VTLRRSLIALTLCAPLALLTAPRVDTRRLEAPHPGLTRAFEVPLPNVTGRIDHLAFDAAGNRLFVAALGNNTIEAIELARRHVTRVGTSSHPQGLAYLANTGRLVVAAADDPLVRAIEPASGTSAMEVRLGEDCDNVRLTADGSRILVGHGDGAIAVLDAEGHVKSDIRVGGHPESFQLEPDSSRVFVNVPTLGQVVVIDRDSGKILARWPVSAAANFPMALDHARHRLFVVSRNPATLLLFDTTSGTLVETLPTVGDGDDVFFDAARRRVYVIGGEGAVAVVDVSSRAREIGRVPTKAGARTGFWVEPSSTLFVAAPARSGTPAAVIAFEAR
jgi:DNA-binding beta-propeller fold protein YncE